jgi:hypothetical protein
MDQQDILLDRIKSYRKVINDLLYNIYKNETNEECKSILCGEWVEKIISIFEYEYDYSYKLHPGGYQLVLEDVNKHKEYISEIMARLKNAHDSDCDKIYNECLTSYIYRSCI